MRLPLHISLAGLLLAAGLLVCCRKEPPAAQEEKKLDVAFLGGSPAQEDGVPILPFRASYESLRVELGGRDASSGEIYVRSNVRWLTVSSGTLAADGMVAIKTQANLSEGPREATLTFTDAANPSRAAHLRLVQLSSSDSDHNADVAREQLYVGYGYDIYKALESPMAVRARMPVLDYPFMVRQLNLPEKYQLIQDCHLSRLDVNYVNAGNIHAYGQGLSQLQTEDKDNIFEGCLDDCNTLVKLLKSTSEGLDQHNYGHGSLEKAVASRIIDRAALLDLKREGRVPYSDEFSTRLHECRRANGETRRQLIESVLTEFGTHVILQVDLGGRIDYSFTMRKSATFNAREEIEQEVNYTLGQIAGIDRTGKNQEPSTSKTSVVTSEGETISAITVRGGGAGEVQALEKEISGLSANGQIDPARITDWLASINYSPHFQGDPSLDVIHFELIPLWDLVTEDVREDFMRVTFALGQRSDNVLPDSFTGMDIYQIDPQGAEKSLFTFPEGGDGSLCRILYMAGEPVLEVCSEYVPMIRSDKRVTIAYPIYQKGIRLNQGLFLGDGTHRPAYVAFSGGDCYVNPFPDMAPDSVLTHFWYVNGNLMPESPVDLPSYGQKGREVRDDAFYFLEPRGTYSHPIVKVGSNFWTRADIDHPMGFCENPHSGYLYFDELVEDDVLYTRFDFQINDIIMEDNDWIWGNERRWYMPTSVEVKSLEAFLGFNPKALFPGQISGFDARFNGYW
ncbi:MAG: hypothetical protein IKN13_04220, partial [Bacteroidales bacterium]|nr:hypothetical protein [Bacteroidales bacterium]